MDQAKLDQLTGFPLLPCGAGEKFKAPLNIETGKPLTGWETMSFTPNQIGAMSGKVICVGTRCGPDAGNLLILDIDGASAETFCKEQVGSFRGIGWRINRTTDPHRFKLAFRVEDPELLSLLDGVGKIVHTTSQEPKEQVELFWATGQCLILGDHRESGGQYQWQGSPVSIKATPKKWKNLLSELIQKHKQKSRKPTGTTDHWRYAIPCPICGRTEPDCRIVDDGSFVQCHKGERWHPPELQVGETIQHGADIWAYVGDGTNAIGECANFKLEKPPFQVLGWNNGWNKERTRIWYRSTSTGQVATFKLGTMADLLPVVGRHWIERRYTDEKGRVRLLELQGDLCQMAEAAGVFDDKRRRGRGVFIDEQRVVLHLGDRLEVDGAITPIHEFQSKFIYQLLPPLEFDPSVAPLTDEEGTKILELLQRGGWNQPDDHLKLMGCIVMAPVGGVVPKRPQTQFKVHREGGKTETLDGTVEPLLAGFALKATGSTEAFIRQTMDCDRRPVLIDESEQGDNGGRTRRDHLLLARYAFDGTGIGRGTKDHESVQFELRSLFFMAGINAEIPDPATKQRFFELSRTRLPQEQWDQWVRERDELITPLTGQRLLRRTLNNLWTIEQNCNFFAHYLDANGVHSREGIKLALALGFAYSLISTEPIWSEEKAQDKRWLVDVEQWLQTNGFTAEPSQDVEKQLDLSESNKCLDHLLTHDVPWSERREVDDTTPCTNRVTVQELLQLLLGNGRQIDERIKQEATKALGRVGVRLYTEQQLGQPDRLTIAVARSGSAIEKVFGRSPWRNGAHRERLLDLKTTPPVVTSSKSIAFTGGGSPVKAVLLPVDDVLR